MEKDITIKGETTISPNYIMDILIKLGYEKYATQIKESLIIDETIVKLGFSQKPFYSYGFTITQKDYGDILQCLDNAYKTDYDLFDDCLTLYNALTIKSIQ
jgi:hypothetical protein